MKKNFLSQSFFAFIFGVPLIMFVFFIANLQTQTNFKKYYSNTPLFKYLQGGVNYFNLKIMQKRILGNVHFGSNEKLFYLPKTDGNVWNDLYGTGPQNDELGLQWERYFSKLVSHPGYFFIVVPNKEKVLVDNLNLYIKPDFRYGWRKIDQIPKQNHVLFAEPKLVPEDYYVSDTHWNHLGAAKIAKEVFSRRKIDLSLLLDEKITIERQGDITRMINNDYFKFYPDSNKEFTFRAKTSPMMFHLQPGVIDSFKNSSAPYKLKVLVLGDSFRESLAEYLSMNVTNVDSVKINQQSHLESLDLRDYDLILDVRVERYLGSVADYNFRSL